MRGKLVGWTCPEGEEGAVEDWESSAVYGGDGGLEVEAGEADLRRKSVRDSL
jgi:hypothetical protein